jgi:hypothetical protein
MSLQPARASEKPLPFVSRHVRPTFSDRQVTPDRDQTLR